MLPRPWTVSVEHVKQELKKLRQGQGLARPSVVVGLSSQLREHLTGGSRDAGDTADAVVHTVAVIRRAVDGLGPTERLYVEVDFNLIPEHSYPTLTERQESLARQLKCAGKTVRRRADQALDTLALVLVTGEGSPAASMAARLATPLTQEAPEEARAWQDELRGFWRLAPQTRVDIVCSEIPEDERPYFAAPRDRNYLRYAKFADLDSLIYVKTHLVQVLPTLAVRDFSPSEYYDTDADLLVVIGGPPWNAKYREFLPQLPYYFEPHPLGEDDPLVVPQLGDLTIGPRWTERLDLLEDLAVFTRLSLAQGTTVFLLGGCLTLGVLGAAKCFLHGARGARNARQVTDLVGDQDFVLVAEARRVGGIADTPDLTMTEPLLLLARGGGYAYSVIYDNTKRYIDA